MIRKLLASAFLAITIAPFVVSLYAQTQYGLFITLGAGNIHYSSINTNVNGDTLSILWSPTSDGTTSYDANDGNGPRTINGALYSPFSDSSGVGTCTAGYNSALGRITVLDFATPGNTRIVAANCWSDFGANGNADAPAGWFSMTTSGGPAVSQTTTHVQRGVSVQGYRIYFYQRGQSGDVGMIMSPPDDTAPMATWFNPAGAFKYSISTEACAANVVTLVTSTNTLTTGDKIWVHGANTNNGVKTVATATATTVTYSSTCINTIAVASGGTVGIGSVNGAAGHCDAIAASNPCLNADYTTNYPWRGATDSGIMSSVTPVVYGQDGGGTGPDGSSTYSYFFTYSIGTTYVQYLHRILTSDLIGSTGNTWNGADPTKWTHYSCSGYSQVSVCDGLASGSWSATVSASTAVTTISAGINSMGQNEGPVLYLSGTKSYHQLVNLNTTSVADTLGILSAPAPWGSYTISSRALIPGGGGSYIPMGFPSFIFPFILSTSATQYTIPIFADDTTTITPGDPVFQQATFNFRHPPTNRYFNNTQIGVATAAPTSLGLVPRIGTMLSDATQWLMTFFDGDPNQATQGATWANLDLPIGTDYCTPSVTSGGGAFVLSLTATGMLFPYGNGLFFPRCVTGTNFPFTGDSAYTATVVFNMNSTPGTTGTIWNTGSYNGAGGSINVAVGGDGSIAVFGDNSHVSGTAASKITFNTVQEVTIIKSGTGSDATTLNFFANGVYVCGPTLGTGTACPTLSAQTMNITAGPLRLGAFGNGDTGACTAGPCAYKLQFVGTIYYYNLLKRGLTKGQYDSNYAGLKTILARRPTPVVLP